MSSTLYMQLYASEVLKHKVGNSMEFTKEEYAKEEEIKIKKDKLGNLELSVFKLCEKPLYEISLSFDKTPDANKDNKSVEVYVIRGITQSEMEDLCKKFAKLYDKIIGEEK